MQDFALGAAALFFPAIFLSNTRHSFLEKEFSPACLPITPAHLYVREKISNFVMKSGKSVQLQGQLLPGSPRREQLFDLPPAPQPPGGVLRGRTGIQLHDLSQVSFFPKKIVFCVESSTKIMCFLPLKRGLGHHLYYAEVTWEFSYHPLNPLTWRLFSESKIYLNRYAHTNQTRSKQKKTRGCTRYCFFSKPGSRSSSSARAAARRSALSTAPSTRDARGGSTSCPGAGTTSRRTRAPRSSGRCSTRTRSGTQSTYSTR